MFFCNVIYLLPASARFSACRTQWRELILHLYRVIEWLMLEGTLKITYFNPSCPPAMDEVTSCHQLPVQGAQDSILPVHRIMESSFYQDSIPPVKCIVRCLRVYFELFTISVKLNPQWQPQSEFEWCPGGISIFTSTFIFLVTTLAFGKLAIK